MDKVVNDERQAALEAKAGLNATEETLINALAKRDKEAFVAAFDTAMDAIENSKKIDDQSLTQKS